MPTLQFGLKSIPVTLLMLFSLFVFADQALADQTPQTTALFSCRSAPHVKAPPSLAQHASVAREQLGSVCAAGLVPQPVNSSSAKLVPIVQKRGAVQPNSSTSYLYADAYQYSAGIGAEGYYTQHAPYLAPEDSHTLAEISGQSADGQQIVEIGWTVDRGINHGDTNPHLFVFSWVNHSANCYNGCGYVQSSKDLYPGMQVAVTDTPQEYGMENYQGNWWLWYQGQWIGYFPGSIWSDKGVTFNQLGFVQWFGEVAANGGSHTQMGNGRFGTDSGSAVINQMLWITSPSTKVPASATSSVTNANCYNNGHFTGSSFTYGGPGC